MPSPAWPAGDYGSVHHAASITKLFYTILKLGHFHTAGSLKTIFGFFAGRGRSSIACLCVGGGGGGASVRACVCVCGGGAWLGHKCMMETSTSIIYIYILEISN